MNKLAPVEKLQSVDLVRSFSILAVLAYHLKNSQVLDSLSPGSNFPWTKFSNNGHLGVSVFFVISGFLITRLIAKQPTGLFKPNKLDFYSRRIGRIIPLLTLVCLVGAWMIYHAPAQTPQFEYCVKSPDAFIGPLHWFSIATFTFNWYVTLFCFHPYLGIQWDILWSLSIEEQFYLFYPLILRQLKRERLLFNFLIFLVFFGLLIRGLNIFLYPDVLSYNSFQNFDMVSIGCLLFLTSERFKNYLGKSKKTCFCFCLSGFALAAMVYFHIPPKPELWFYLFGRFLLGSGVFLFLLGAIHQKWFESGYFRPFSLPGHLSYGMYLLHPLVLYFMWNTLKGQNTWLSYFLFTFVTVTIAYLSYRFYEMPMNLWLRKGLGRMDKLLRVDVLNKF